MTCTSAWKETSAAAPTEHRARTTSISNSRQTVLERLSSSIPVIAPSMLKCDFGNLDREIARLEAAGAHELHLDVMDGHFVPNLSYGAPVIERLRKCTKMPFEAHLMISEPAQYLDDFLKAGCNVITFHIEAVPEPGSLLQRIHANDAVAGLAINPKTPIERLEPHLDATDVVLVMSVEPGFGGQKFMPKALDKVRWLKEWKRRRGTGAGPLISIDGGIDLETIKESARAGVDLFVVGSAIFGMSDYGRAIRDLTDKARAGFGLN